MPSGVPRVVLRSRVTVGGTSQEEPGAFGYPMAAALRDGVVLAIPLREEGFIPPGALWEEHIGPGGTFAYVQQADSGPVALAWSGAGEQVGIAPWTPGETSQQWRKAAAGEAWLHLAQGDGAAVATVEPIPDPELTAPIFTQPAETGSVWQQWRTLPVPDPLHLTPDAVRALFRAGADA